MKNKNKKVDAINNFLTIPKNWNISSQKFLFKLQPNDRYCFGILENVPKRQIDRNRNKLVASKKQKEGQNGKIKKKEKKESERIHLSSCPLRCPPKQLSYPYKK